MAENRTQALRRCGLAFVVYFLPVVFRTQSAPAPVNPLLARALYDVSQHDLSPIGGNPDRAIQHLKILRGKDVGNGLIAYEMAAAYAKKRDWKSASREIKAGNTAPYIVHYVDNGPFRLFSAYPRLRVFANDCAAVAPSLGVDKGADLLRDVRTMAKKIAGAEPRGVVPVLVGAVVRGAADKGLVDLYEKAKRSKELAEARKLQEADSRWAQQVRAETKPILDQTDPTVLVRKHFTQAEWQASNQGTKITPSVKKKLDAMTKEIDSLERPAAEKALRSMPD